METGVPLAGRRSLQAPGSVPSGICPGTVAEDPASERTRAPGTEPDQKADAVLCF